MALQRSMLGSHPLLLVVLFAVGVLLAMAALTWFFGVDITGPSYEIVPDPAGTLPF